MERFDKSARLSIQGTSSVPRLHHCSLCMGRICTNPHALEEATFFCQLRLSGKALYHDANALGILFELWIVTFVVCFQAVFKFIEFF